MIPCCHESAEEINITISNFYRKNIDSLSLRNQLTLFIFLDRQPEEGPDTPTFVALKQALNLTTNKTKMSYKHGCRVWEGNIEGIPFYFYVKGNNTLSGKRHSQLIFSKVIEDIAEAQNFILLVDGDTKIGHNSIQLLLDELNKYPKIGGIEGHLKVKASPKKNLITILQCIEYNFNFPIIKMAESTLNSCTCLDGGYALVRYSAWKKILPDYSRIPDENDIISFNQLELGEDHYMTTLLLQNGYHTSACQTACVETSVPDTLEAFFTQRKRWTSSFLVNNFELLFSRSLLKLSNIPFLIQWFFVLYRLALFVMTPALITMFITNTLFIDELVIQTSSNLLLFYMFIFGISVMNQYPETILGWLRLNTVIFSVLCGFSFLIILSKSSFILLVLLPTIISFMIANISFIYFPFFISLAFSLYLLIPIYSVANIDNYSWGSRGIKTVSISTNTSQSSKTTNSLIKFTKWHKKIFIYGLWFVANLIIINTIQIVSVLAFVILLFISLLYSLALIYYFQHK